MGLPGTKEAVALKETFSGEEVLGMTFTKLLRENRTQVVSFPNGISVECEEGDPIDGEGSEDLVYKNAFRVQIGIHDWVIARGQPEESRSFTTRFSGGDILAFPFNLLSEGKKEKSYKELTEEVGKRIKDEGRYFSASLIIGKSDGGLQVSENSPFARWLLLALPREARELIVNPFLPQRPEATQGVRPTYGPEMVEQLAQAIEDVLFFKSLENPPKTLGIYRETSQRG